MFRSEGANRTDRLNRVLAGYLAFVGGYVNSTGLVLLGVLTSHVTGNVARGAAEIASAHPAQASVALSMVGAFFIGALVASMIVESDFWGSKTRGYGVALSVELACLAAFAVMHDIVHASWVAHPEALSLCLAMGMQNSLVTRLSGAVVRTTHLTGVVTDLGIEAARWFRWWRARATEATGVKLAFGRNPAVEPAPAKVALLGTIAGAFALGALAGSAAALLAAKAAVIFPSLAIGGAAFYAVGTSPEAAARSIPPESRG